MSKISRRDFLKVTGVAAAAATLTACGGSSSSTASSAASAASSAASSEVVKKLDKISIAVPNDTTNEARALLLLADNGVITLREGAGLTATKRDIASYSKKIDIVELEAAQIPRMRSDFALVVLNGNYALQAGLSVGRDAIVAEKSDSEAAKTYVNIIAVKDGNQDAPAVKMLVETLKSQPIRDFIEKKYDGAVVPFN